MPQELHGIPMLRVFTAILYFERKKKLAVSTRLSKYLNKPVINVINLLRLYWGWGYLNRKPVQSNNNKRRKVDKCTWYYFLSPKGHRKYLKLMQIWGDVVNSVPPADLARNQVMDRKDMISVPAVPVISGPATDRMS